jgi:chromosomal replication initiator protein
LRSAQEIWEAALGELQLQVNKPNYDTWLKDTSGISYQDDLFVVGVRNVFIAEWLTNRLYSVIKRTLASITGGNLHVQFLIQPPGQPDTHLAHACQADGGTSSRSKQLTKAPKLNVAYTFNTFITGESNRLAYAAALEVAEEPGRTYNPLFIYGDTGVGKTHLLHAVAHALKASGPRILYVNAEQFTNQFIVALKNQKTEDFHHKFRSADVLLVDDIQFLSGKAQTQECFFHIFNELYDNNCQIVVTSDRSPKAMSSVTKRLRSRFEWGLIVDIQAPDLETRLTILRTKARRLNMSISSEVLRFLATQLQHNVRELEGALNRVVTYAKLSGTKLDIQVAAEAVQDLVADDNHQEAISTPKQIMNAVASYYSVTLEALTGERRDKKTALPRQVAMYLLREQNHCGLAEIGEILGGRDHTTILHGYKKIASEINTNSQLSKSIEQIRQQVTAKKPLA